MLTIVLVATAPSTDAVADSSRGNSPFHLKKSKIDLGTIRGGDPAMLTFELANDSGKAVIVVSAEGGCRCTSLVSAPDEIGAHKSGLFKFLFNPAYAEPGVETKTVSIDLADHDSVIGTFTVKIE